MAARNDGLGVDWLLATTYFAAPLVGVNGPVAGSIDLNSWERPRQRKGRDVATDVR